MIRDISVFDTESQTLTERKDANLIRKQVIYRCLNKTALLLVLLVSVLARNTMVSGRSNVSSALRTFVTASNIIFSICLYITSLLINYLSF